MEESPEGARQDVDTFTHPTYSLSNRTYRFAWFIANWALFKPSPTPLHRWRSLLLNAFGAKVSYSAHVYPSCEIWSPRNLEMAEQSALGPRVRCYNPAKVYIGFRAVVSQDVELCTASHDISDQKFRLIAAPIIVGSYSWIAAKAFVGPGVTTGEHSVVGACSVVFRNIEPRAIVIGNPAAHIRFR